MDRWKFQQMIPNTLSDDEWERIELVFMNIQEIATMERMSQIVSSGMEYVDILHQATLERGKLIETVGDLKRKMCEAQAENRRLRDFRSRTIQAYKEMEHNGEC